MSAAVTACLGAIQDGDRYASALVPALKSPPVVAISASTEPSGQMTTAVDFGQIVSDLSLANRVYSKATSTCSRLPTADPPPQRRALGDNLGPFSLVAAWLLRTESLSLTLIIGMLGFGLLGSAAASFLKARAPATGSPTHADLEAVVIRGVTAAMVVFLAVEGGLAVFSAGSAEPNPYVLLLTCLVAAAYSDTVWDWALERLKSQLGGKGGGGGGGGSGGTGGGVAGGSSGGGGVSGASGASAAAGGAGAAPATP